VTLYFDPARRAVAVTPPPAVVKASPRSSPGYFDPSKPRLPRSDYPSADEIAALVASFDAVTLASVEALKAHGETVFDNVTRRVAGVKRCAGCGALGGGEFGHRHHCPEYRERLWLSERPWLWRRREASGDSAETGAYDDPDDDLPF
jgi:hypothetical protein